MIAVRKLEAGDDLSSFNSGNKQLDRWVKRYGLENQLLYGMTYLAVDDADGAIVGFVTVASTSVDRARLGVKDGPPRWPALLLGRMAVSKERQGQRLGERLLRHVFELAIAQQETTGCALVIVDSKPESVGFYKKYLFEPMPVLEGSTTSQTAMYLELGTVAAAMKA